MPDLNRRGFLGALFGGAAAAALPISAPATALAFHPAAFAFVYQTLDLAAFQAGYLDPYVRSVADQMDASVFSFRRSQRITVADSRRFDPARLPL